MGKEKGNGYTDKTKRKLSKAVIIIVTILVLILAALFPFVLDSLYGKGRLKAIYPNAFPAEVWFSFIGSYFPAAIIGIITLYQAYIIQRQDKQYKNLLARHRFIPEEHAHVYRANLKEKKLGNYTVPEIEKLLMRDEKLELLAAWDKGYIIECNIYDTSGIGVERVVLKSICWVINDKEYIQKDSGQMACIIGRTGRNQYCVTVFFLFDESTDAKGQITKCMISTVRNDSDYKKSKITMEIQIIDDIDENSNLELKLELQSQNGSYEMMSVTEKIYVR